MRLWDQRTASGVDEFIANSHFIGRRINKSYRRQSTVIYPPVDGDFFRPAPGRRGRGEYFLVVSALVPYKKVELAVEVFNRLGYGGGRKATSSFWAGGATRSSGSITVPAGP